MDRRGRTGKIEDGVDLDVKRKRNVVPDRLEQRILDQMRDVAAAAGEVIVDGYDLGTGCEQPLAKM